MSLAPERLTIGLDRLFTSPGVDPYDEVVWERRDARITNWKDGAVAFEQLGVEFPVSWSVNATNIVVPEVLPGHPGHAGAGVVAAPGHRPGGRHDHHVGPRGRLLRRRRGGPGVHRRAELHPRDPAGRLQQPGVVQHRRRRACRSRRRPASSSPSTTRWTRSSTGTGRRASSSRAAPARASTCRGSAPATSCSRAAARPRARSASCAAPTPRRARSSRAARPGGPPRWSSSTSTTRTSRSSSGARSRRSARRASCVTTASTWTSTASDSFSIQYQNANNSVRVTDEFMQAVAEDADWGLVAVTTGEVLRTDQGPRPVAPDRPGGVGVRRPRPAVRHHDQPLAHGPHDRSDQRQQPVLGVHAPRQLGVQPGLDQPAPLPRRRGQLRRRGVPPHRRDHLHGAGDPRRPGRLPDAADRRDEPRLPPARHRLRQPRRDADGARAALRLRRGSGVGRLDHVADDGPRLRHERPHGQPHGPVRRLRRERGAHAAGAADAPRRQLRHRRHRRPVPAELLAAGQESWDSAVRDGEEHGVRNSQASVLAPDRHDRPDDGLRHHRHRARPRPRQDEEAGRRRAPCRSSTRRSRGRCAASATRPPQVDEIIAYIDPEKSIIGAPHLDPAAPRRCSPARWATTRSTTRATCG